MAKIVLVNPVITVNSVDLSDHIASVTITKSVNEVTTTAFTSGTSAGVTRVGGLEDNSIALSFHQDFATGSNVEAIVYPLIGGTTTITIKPVNSTTTSTNPSYSATVFCGEWTPINGAVGDLSTADVTWPVSGIITKSTS
jgi:hypothetical protein